MVEVVEHMVEDKLEVEVEHVLHAMGNQAHTEARAYKDQGPDDGQGGMQIHGLKGAKIPEKGMKM